ncbi:MAG: hypothetical protein RH917_16195 [Lacipirellulaceae bacterium]
MIQPKQLLLCSLMLLSTSSAVAQHIDILVFDANGKAAVGEYDFISQSASERLVHLARFDSDYTVNNPGFISVLGLDPLPGNQQLRWEFLPLTIDSGPHAGHRSTLLYWDGNSASPEFGPTATNDYEFSLFGIHGSATAHGTSDVEEGSIIAPTPPNGTIHEHLDFFLDDNGDGLNTSLPAAGIYVLGMRLKIAGLEDSDPFYMVWATPEVSILPDIQPAAAWVTARVDSLFVDAIPGDFNGDNSVDGNDFLAWQRDHVALGGDNALMQWQTNYGEGSAATVSALAVPEPEAFLLFTAGLSVLALLPRRK